MVAVGYIDPGNWATDIAGGSRYAYALLSVVFGASLLAMLVQTMSARLGIATGVDLAAASRAAYPRAAPLLWATAELAVIATDLAEVLGSAIALELLFGVPLALGVVVTALDVAVLLMLDRRGTRALERVVASLVVVIAVGFAYELALTRPSLGPLLAGFVPSARVARDPRMLYMAIGIVGATVMPHNLYLHSSLMPSRVVARSARARRSLARLATFDTVACLACAMALNAALVVLAAAVFHEAGHEDVASIVDAHRLLAPLLGSTLAPIVFAVALLAAGQSATITGTLAGQVIMSGFLRIAWPPWKRRLVTRACAIVPAAVTIALAGEESVGDLLVASQVVLSLQLPFAMAPLVALTSDPGRMGGLRNAPWMRRIGWIGTAAVILANGALVVGLLRGG